MRHGTIRKKLLRFLDNDLSRRDAERIERHLERCRKCREDLQFIESLFNREQPVERMAAPPYLWTRISARLRSPGEPGYTYESTMPFRLLLRPVVMIAALVFIFIGGIKLGTLMPEASGARLDVLSEGKEENFGLVYFDILPPGSLDLSVLAVVESEGQK